MKLVFRYLRKHPWLLIFNVLAVIAVAAAEIGIPLVISFLIDKGMLVGDTVIINKLIITLFLVAIAGGIGQLILNFCAAKISTTVTKEVRIDIYRKVQTFSQQNYNKFGISSLISRTTSDIFQIMQFTNMFFRIALMSPALITISIVLSAVRAPGLLFVTFATLPFVILVIVLIAVLSAPLSMKQQVGIDNLNRISRENLTGARVIRAFRKSKYEQKRFNAINQDYTNNSVKLYRLMNIAEPSFFFILNISSILIVLLGGNMIASSLAGTGASFSLGNLTEFIDYQFHIMFSVLQIAILFMMYPRTRVSASRIQEIFETIPEITSKDNAITMEKSPSIIEFKNVSFKYPDGNSNVLENINFTAKSGEKVSFIGSTGSGKSTLIQLIPRFYDVTSGEILIDNTNITDYELSSLRENIGYIAQKALLFSGTIEENIKFGKKTATSDEVIAAAKISQAAAFIQTKPKQYLDLVSEGGVNMSGGQKQRLSIARAVIRKPGIYIFDDSFSALDYKTDAVLRSTLEKNTDNSIMLVVAQRISSIIDSDQILVLDEGKIIGKGTHTDLLETCPVYLEIVNSQMNLEELL